LPAAVPSEPFGPPFLLLGVSEAILGALHDRIFFRELFESARDYNHNQLVYSVQECYGSIMVQYGNIFILVDEDYFRHQQFFVAVVIPC